MTIESAKQFLKQQHGFMISQATRLQGKNRDEIDVKAELREINILVIYSLKYGRKNKEQIAKDVDAILNQYDQRSVDSNLESELAKCIMAKLTENNQLSEFDFLPLLFIYLDQVYFCEKETHLNLDKLYSELAKQLHEFAGCWARVCSGWKKAFKPSELTDTPIKLLIAQVRTTPYWEEYLSDISHDKRKKPLSSLNKVLVTHVCKKILNEKHILNISNELVTASETSSFNFEDYLESFVKQTINRNKNIYYAMVDALVFTATVCAHFKSDEVKTTITRKIAFYFDLHGYSSVKKQGGWEEVLKLGTQSCVGYLLSQTGLFETCETAMSIGAEGLHFVSEKMNEVAKKLSFKN